MNLKKIFCCLITLSTSSIAIGGAQEAEEFVSVPRKTEVVKEIVPLRKKLSPKELQVIRLRIDGEYKAECQKMWPKMYHDKKIREIGEINLQNYVRDRMIMEIFSYMIQKIEERMKFPNISERKQQKLEKRKEKFQAWLELLSAKP